MQAYYETTAPPRSTATGTALERITAVVEAALGYAPLHIRELIRTYLGLASKTYEVYIVMRRAPGSPKPQLMRLRCLEPSGDTSRAERLGLLINIGSHRCVVYPGEELAASVCNH